MSPKDIGEILDAITARASAMTAAGIRGRVKIGDLEFSLEGDEASCAVTGSADIAATMDALHDPATHGIFGEDAVRRRPRHVRPPLIGDDT